MQLSIGVAVGGMLISSCVSSCYLLGVCGGGQYIGFVVRISHTTCLKEKSPDF